MRRRRRSYVTAAGAGFFVVWRARDDVLVMPEERRSEIEARLAEPVEEFYSVPIYDESETEIIGIGCHATRLVKPGSLKHAEMALRLIPGTFLERTYEPREQP
ncbi:hypothetical protein BH23CHL7_BH23CHL7_08140 [soil metagenome]